MAIPLPPVSGPPGEPDPKVPAVEEPDDEPTPIEEIRARAATGDALAQWALDVASAMETRASEPDSD